MLFEHQFKVDKIILKNANDPERVVDIMREHAAHELGEKIIAALPYRKEEYEGEVPEMSLNREHQFNDVYKHRLIIITEEELLQKIKKLESDAEELIQERDNEEEGYIRLAKANALKSLLT